MISLIRCNIRNAFEISELNPDLLSILTMLKSYHALNQIKLLWITVNYTKLLQDYILKQSTRPIKISLFLTNYWNWDIFKIFQVVISLAGVGNNLFKKAQRWQIRNQRGRKHREWAGK